VLSYSGDGTVVVVGAAVVVISEATVAVTVDSGVDVDEVGVVEVDAIVEEWSLVGTDDCSPVVGTKDDPSEAHPASSRPAAITTAIQRTAQPLHHDHLTPSTPRTRPETDETHA
jgi:hypothetical protein